MAKAPGHVDMEDSQPVLSSENDVADNSFINVLAFLPIPGFICVREREAQVELCCGKYVGTVAEPGCYCRNVTFVTFERISTAITTIDLNNTRVLDRRGNPLIISALITYQVVEPRRAALDVTNVNKFVHDQGQPVLKRVVSQFPYESEEEGVPSLKTEAQVVTTELERVLQAKTRVAGVKIMGFVLNELSYAPEIANVMLKRQAADALIDARSRIVMGAVAIAKEAADKLGNEEVTAADKSKLLANLVTVMVAEKDVAPVVSVG